MNTKPTTTEASGTGMLLVISFATMFVVAAECVFLAFASWLLLPVILLTVIVMALVVIGAVLHTIDGGGFSGPSPSRKTAPATQPTAPARTAVPRAVRHA